MGLRFMDDVPFTEVYIHGLIRDSHGQKMSKSKGNVLDPIDLIDGIDLESLVAKRTAVLMQPQMAPAIEIATREEFPGGIPAYGCDALRISFAALATTGRDIRFELGRIEGNRNFCNKLWNAARYVLMQTEGHEVEKPGRLSAADRWILSRAHRMVAEVRQHIESYRMDLAAHALYEFAWNEYCDWYLELSKPALQQAGEAAGNATRHTLLQVLEILLRALHPFMPFISEEIWQRLRKPLKLQGDTIMLSSYPEAGQPDLEAEQDIEWLKDVLQGIRRIRSELNLAPSLKLPVQLQAGNETDRDRTGRFEPLLSSLGRVETMSWLADDADSSNAAVALVGDLRVLIPLAGLIDVQAELQRLNKQLAKEQADLKQSQGKLSNKRFVDNAPEAVVQQEKQRLETHQFKVAQIKEQIERLEKL